jgi:hypothetical protein
VSLQRRFGALESAPMFNAPTKPITRKTIRFGGALTGAREV